ncbi:hypothetical protein CVT26_005514 [Gymnopilus dilepis]|uniref:Uncharacterized protein n=1 Tax=Gymnopilus dilepis TaxID=231916 RepID=A0A409WYV9_9AGAR|nr:hypothetical protein CVT26_005514 [Gymnopilus dilepis]
MPHTVHQASGRRPSLQSRHPYLRACKHPAPSRTFNFFQHPNKLEVRDSLNHSTQKPSPQTYAKEARSRSRVSGSQSTTQKSEEVEPKQLLLPGEGAPGKGKGGEKGREETGCRESGREWWRGWLHDGCRRDGGGSREAVEQFQPSIEPGNRTATRWDR